MSSSSPAGSSPTPEQLPTLPEVLRYFAGAARLMMGRPDGLDLLDTTADGFWRSFAAIPVALPPTILSWIEFERVERAGTAAPAGAATTYAAHALADLSAWILPVVVLMVLARPLGFSRKIGPLVVATNWGGALTVWAFAPFLLLVLLLGRGDVADALGVVVALASIALTARLVMAATGSDVATGIGITVLLVLCSLLSYGAASDLFGVALV